MNKTVKSQKKKSVRRNTKNLKKNSKKSPKIGYIIYCDEIVKIKIIKSIKSNAVQSASYYSESYGLNVFAGESLISYYDKDAKLPRIDVISTNEIFTKELDAQKNLLNQLNDDLEKAYEDVRFIEENIENCNKRIKRLSK